VRDFSRRVSRVSAAPSGCSSGESIAPRHRGGWLAARRNSPVESSRRTTSFRMRHGRSPSEVRLSELFATSQGLAPDLQLLFPRGPPGVNARTRRVDTALLPLVESPFPVRALPIS